MRRSTQLEKGSSLSSHRSRERHARTLSGSRASNCAAEEGAAEREAAAAWTGCAARSTAPLSSRIDPVPRASASALSLPDWPAPPSSAPTSAAACRRWSSSAAVRATAGRRQRDGADQVHLVQERRAVAAAAASRKGPAALARAERRVGEGRVVGLEPDGVAKRRTEGDAKRHGGGGRDGEGKQRRRRREHGVAKTDETETL